MFFSKHLPIFIALVILAAGGGVWWAIRGETSSPRQGSEIPAGAPEPPPASSVSVSDEHYVYDPKILADATTIFADQNALYSYIKKFGPKKTVARLDELSTSFGSCHTAAHQAGRLTYAILGNQAFQQCSAECHSGCYHGATEAFFRDHGTANLAQNLAIICSSAENSFFSHQCIHGIGHGLMAWTDYDLLDALKSCDLLAERQDSCWTGVFMENIVGGLAKSDVEKNPKQADHFSKFLSSDPRYPCDDPQLDPKYISSCYFLQTSRMLQIFGADWKKVSASCLASPSGYQRSCFESMGRDVGGNYPTDNAKAIAACSEAPSGTLRIGCLIGAAQNTFWDPSGQNLAIDFCTRLTDPQEKNACYDTIFQRAPDVLTSKARIEAFCAKAEPSFRDRCLANMR